MCMKLGGPHPRLQDYRSFHEVVHLIFHFAAVGEKGHNLDEYYDTQKGYVSYTCVAPFIPHPPAHGAEMSSDVPEA